MKKVARLLRQRDSLKGQLLDEVVCGSQELFGRKEEGRKGRGEKLRRGGGPGGVDEAYRTIGIAD